MIFILRAAATPSAISEIDGFGKGGFFFFIPQIEIFSSTITIYKDDALGLFWKSTQLLSSHINNVAQRELLTACMQSPFDPCRQLAASEHADVFSDQVTEPLL